MVRVVELLEAMVVATAHRIHRCLPLPGRRPRTSPPSLLDLLLSTRTECRATHMAWPRCLIGCDARMGVQGATNVERRWWSTRKTIMVAFLRSLGTAPLHPLYPCAETDLIGRLARVRAAPSSKSCLRILSTATSQRPLSRSRSSQSLSHHAISSTLS
jgi:hypothetical protein